MKEMKMKGEAVLKLVSIAVVRGDAHNGAAKRTMARHNAQ